MNDATPQFNGNDATPDYIRMKKKDEGTYGFKNGAPAFTGNSWNSVQLFLDTWGFLPNDESVLDTLERKQLNYLCICALEAACNIDLDGNNIKGVQEIMHDMGISPLK